MHVLRQDPDVIVIGEMRDPETIETALVASETGHLVFATLPIVSQKLLPRAQGSGRMLACEIAICTLAVRNHIRERQVHQIYSEMQTGRKHQMQTMDGALLELYQRGEISYDTAVSNARDPNFMRHKLEGPSG